MYFMNGHTQPDPDAKPNLNPVVTTPPVFLNSTTNGKLYSVGDADDLIYLLHVWGKLHDCTVQIRCKVHVHV